MNRRLPFPLLLFVAGTLLAVAVVVVLQWRSRNALLSILVGTAVYVLMRNLSLW